MSENAVNKTETVSKDVCKILHKQIDEKFEEQDKKFAIHDENLMALNRSDATNTQSIISLCKQMGGLTKAIWGLVIMVATALLGFFFYVVEKGIFK